MKSQTSPLLSGHQLVALLDEFGAAFNREDLDSVMSYFSEDAVYDTMSGKTCAGHDQIRAELQPQFDHNVGRLHFEAKSVYVDESAQVVVTEWTCQHNLESGAAPSAKLLAVLGRLPVIGRGFKWEGIDIYTVRDGQIVRKQTFGQTKVPLLRLM